MKPVTQTKFGSDIADVDNVGNCMAACVASILELDLVDVPNFLAAGEDLWWSELQSWLSEFGLAYIEIALKDGAKATLHVPPGAYYILTGKSPRGDFLHAVVYCDYELAHDPHPSGEGIESSEILGFFVPLNPQLNTVKGPHTMEHEGYRGLPEKLRGLKDDTQDPQVKEQLEVCASWAETLISDMDRHAAEAQDKQRKINQDTKTLGMISHLITLRGE